MEVTLSRLPEDNAAPTNFSPASPWRAISDELRRTYRVPDEVDGLVVTEIADDSPFREQFRPGMVIVQVNRAPVEDVASARALLRPGLNFCYVWIRGGFRYITFKSAVTDCRQDAARPPARLAAHRADGHGAGMNHGDGIERSHLPGRRCCRGRGPSRASVSSCLTCVFPVAMPGSD